MAEDFLGLFSEESIAITFEAGRELFKKGDPGHDLYVVKSGEIQIVDGNHVLETVTAGGIIGEMALVDGGPRSATARAVTESVVVPIDERRFLFLVQQTPFFAIRVMRLMSTRLRAMNERARTLD
ncbi:MAG: Crp/Fnr family transcriptional regulator [Xanthobacteraceae bacterium]